MAVYKKRLLTAKPDQAEEEPSLKNAMKQNQRKNLRSRAVDSSVCGNCILT